MAEMTTSSPGPDLPAPETLGDEVDALGGAADEDDLARFGRVEEALHLARASS